MVKIKKRKKGKENKKERSIIPASEFMYSIPLDKMFREFDRMFDDFRRNFEDTFLLPLKERKIGIAKRFGDRFPEIFLDKFFKEPNVDLIDRGKEFLLKAELPGVEKKDVEIEVSNDEIEIKAERGFEKEEKDECYLYRERGYNSFYRKVNFPEEVIPDKVEAKMSNGILEVKLPKKTPKPKPKKKKIKVK